MTYRPGKLDPFFPQEQLILITATEPAAGAIVTIPDGATDVRLFIPTIDSATVQLFVKSPDGTNWAAAHTPGDSIVPVDSIIAASDGDFVVDISKLALPGYEHKVVFGAAQNTAARTVYFMSR